MANLTWKLKSAYIWLRRICHCRGFGVQSPWAYRFVCNVINGHSHYPGYDEVRRDNPQLSPLSVKLGQLYLRISNHISPQTVVNIGTDSEAFRQYVLAGCRSAYVISLSQDEPTATKLNAINQVDSLDMLRFAPSQDCPDLLTAALAKAHDGSVLIIEGIHGSKQMRQLWTTLLQSAVPVVTFDLYYCGVACFQSKRYKQNYIVNF